MRVCPSCFGQIIQNEHKHYCNDCNMVLWIDKRFNENLAVKLKYDKMMNLYFAQLAVVQEMQKELQY